MRYKNYHPRKSYPEFTGPNLRGRRASHSSEERIEALKRLSRAVVERERANREFYAALVQAHAVGLKWRQLMLTCRASEDTLRKRIRQLANGIPEGFMWQI